MDPCPCSGAGVTTFRRDDRVGGSALELLENARSTKNNTFFLSFLRKQESMEKVPKSGSNGFLEVPESRNPENKGVANARGVVDFVTLFFGIGITPLAVVLRG